MLLIRAFLPDLFSVHEMYVSMQTQQYTQPERTHFSHTDAIHLTPQSKHVSVIKMFSQTCFLMATSYSCLLLLALRVTQDFLAQVLQLPHPLHCLQHVSPQVAPVTPL